MLRPTVLQSYRPLFRLVFATVIASRGSLRIAATPSMIPRNPQDAKAMFLAELARAQRDTASTFPNASWLDSVQVVVKCWIDDYLSQGFPDWKRGSLAGDAYMGQFKKAAELIVTDHSHDSDLAVAVLGWCLDHGFEFKLLADAVGKDEFDRLVGPLRKRRGVELDDRPAESASSFLLKKGEKHKPLATLLQGWRTKRLSKAAIVMGSSALLVLVVAFIARYAAMESAAMQKPLAQVEWKAQP